MKRIVMFVVLKIAEVLAAWFCLITLPYWMGRKWFTEGVESAIGFWAKGILMMLVGIFSLMLTGMVIALFVAIVRANWDWAGKLTRKLKG